MYVTELLKKTEQELLALRDTSIKELGDFTQKLLQKKEKNVKKAGQFKKLIARINTVINQKKENLK